MALQRTPEYTLGNATTPITLTNSYSANVGTPVYIGAHKYIMIDVDYTMGADETSNKIQLKVEFADPDPSLTKSNLYVPASTDWRQMVVKSTTGGVTTLTELSFEFTAVSAAGTYDRISFPIDLVDCKHGWIRVSAQESGIAANGGHAVVSIQKFEEETIN